MLKRRQGLAKKKLYQVKNFTHKLPKKFINVIMILVFSFLSIVIFVNKEKFSPDYIGIFINDIFAQLQHGPGYPYKICGDKVNSQNFKCAGKNIFLLSDTFFTVLNGSAKEMYKNKHSYQNPQIKLNNNREIIYDSGGKKLEILSKSKILNTLNLDNNIISTAMSDQGTYAVLTEAQSFCSQLTVFSKDGKNIYYKYDFADCYMTDVAISSNGKFAAACGNTSQNGEMVSSFYLFDYTSKTPKIKFDYNDNMFIKIEYLLNGNIAVIGDNLISVINPRNSSKQDYMYDGRSLVNLDINICDGILLLLTLSENNSNNDVIFINKSGKVESNFHFDYNAEAVSFNHGKFAILSYGKVYIFNTSGKETKTIDVGNDVKNINLCSNNYIYALGAKEIRKIRI